MTAGIVAQRPELAKAAAKPSVLRAQALMKRYKKRVDVFQKEHRYHFGSHEKAKRNLVQEYLLVGTG